MGTTALLLEARSRNELFPERESLPSLPSLLGHWSGRDINLDQQTLEILGAGEFLLRDYDDIRNSELPVNLFIAYFPSQRSGDTIHSPSHCLPGAGWVPVQKEIIHISRTDGTSFAANRYVVSKAGEHEMVIYWYQAHNRAFASEYWAKYYLVADSIRMNRSDGALVRLVTPMLHGESPVSAEARALDLGSQVLPLLDRFIPR